MPKKGTNLDAIVRHRKAAKNLVAGMPVGEALRAAGYAASTAKHTSGRVLDAIRHDLAEELNRQIPREKIVKRLLDICLYSKKVTRLQNPKTGEISEFEDDDLFVSVKAIELLGKLTGTLIRREEGNVTHDFESLADAIRQARGRVGMLPEHQPEVTAQVVRDSEGEHES